MRTFHFVKTKGKQNKTSYQKSNLFLCNFIFSIIILLQFVDHAICNQFYIKALKIHQLLNISNIKSHICLPRL